MYRSSSWARILIVWDIIKERTKETSSDISSRVFLPPPLLVLANNHSILTYDVPRTEDVGLPTKFRFNVGPALQPIAGSMLVNRLWRWTNTKLSLGLLYNLRKHVTFNHCFFNVDPQSSTLARHWNSIGWLYRVFWLLHYAGDTFTSRRQKHQITRYIGPNADVMLGHRLRRLANIIPTKTLYALNHKYDREYFLF